MAGLLLLFSVNATVRMFAKLQFAIRTSLFSSIGYIGISRKERYWNILFVALELAAIFVNIQKYSTTKYFNQKNILSKSLQSGCMFAVAQSIHARRASKNVLRVSNVKNTNPTLRFAHRARRMKKRGFHVEVGAQRVS